MEGSRDGRKRPPVLCGQAAQPFARSLLLPAGVVSVRPLSLEITGSCAGATTTAPKLLAGLMANLLAISIRVAMHGRASRLITLDRKHDDAGNLQDLQKE